MQFIENEVFSNFYKVLKSLLMHGDINFKINRDIQTTRHFLGTILFSNISIKYTNHYQGIIISEIYKAH